MHKIDSKVKIQTVLASWVRQELFLILPYAELLKDTSSQPQTAHAADTSLTAFNQTQTGALTKKHHSH